MKTDVAAVAVNHEADGRHAVADVTMGMAADNGFSPSGNVDGAR